MRANHSYPRQSLSRDLSGQSDMGGEDEVQTRYIPTRMSADDYQISPRAYLARARQNLTIGYNSFLYYAALELRFCLERRQDQYLEAQKDYVQSLPRSWEISKKRKVLDAAIACTETIKFTFIIDKLGIILYYVPITGAIVNKAERLGNYLHCQDEYKQQDDPFWTELKSELSSLYRDLWGVCYGDVLCPPVLAQSGQMIGNLKFDAESNAAREMYNRAKKGTKFHLQVEYLDEMPKPDEWEA